jgi:hypothetical protein
MNRNSRGDEDQELITIIGSAWSDCLKDPFQLLEDDDIELLGAQLAPIDRSVDDLLGLPEGAWGSIPESPLRFPLALRYFCSQPVFGVTMDPTDRVRADLEHTRPSSWEATEKTFLNFAGVPCMLPSEMMTSTVELLTIALRRLYDLPDFADEDHYVRGIDNDDSDGLQKDGTFVDAIFPLAKSMLQHKLLFLGGRRDYQCSYALFYIDINETSRHYGGVYYQDGFAYLETRPHDPNGPPRWK